MIAVLINCATVIAGSLIGLLVGKKLSDSFKSVVFSCSGLVTIIMGIEMSMGTMNYLALLLAMLLGGAVGSLLKIEDWVLSIGDKLQAKLDKKSGDNKSSFAIGFMNASVLFCSGAMSVVGSIQAGTTGEINTILVKSVMDGCMAVVFASIYGIGVMFSSLFIFIYQGFFTIAGSFIQPLIGETGINAIASAGGVLLLMIGLGLIDVKKFKTADFIPSLVFAPVMAILVDKIF